MPALNDITNREFGSWTVIKYAGKSKWQCRCKCGNVAVVAGATLRNGTSTQCRACATSRLNHITKIGNKNNFTHGQCRTRLYRIWCGMISRCETKSSSGYKWYGANGVKVCNEWHSFEAFRDWAIANGYDPELSIDRIDVYGDYSPETADGQPDMSRRLIKETAKETR